MTLDDLKRMSELEASAPLGPFYATRDTNGHHADGEVWTVGPLADEENWRTDSGYPGYGVDRATAELLAALRTHARAMLDWLIAEEKHHAR